MARGNQHGLYCPSCGHDDELWVSGTVTIQCARLVSDGADYDGGDFCWGDDDSAGCTWCGWEATAGELLSEGGPDFSDEVLAEVVRHYGDMNDEIPGTYFDGGLPEYGDEDEGEWVGLVEDDEVWEDLTGRSVIFVYAGLGDSDAPYAPYFGQRAVVARSVLEPEENFDYEVLPMYLLRFADGYETYAWRDEVNDELPGEI